MSICSLIPSLGHLLDVEFALVLALIEEVMRYLDGIIGVVDRVLMLVYLTEQSANLHMRFAFVLQHFEAKRGLLRVIEVLLEVVALKMVDASLQANGTLL